MKVFLKNIVLFVILSFAFSALISCTKTPEPAVETNSASTNSNAATEKSKVNYPPAPTVVMTSPVKDLDGNTFKLEDKKGKVLLINLWAIYCGPCREEMPELVAMQDKFKDKGFEVIGLNTNESEDSVPNVKAFAEKMKLNYQLAYADDGIMTEFVKLTKLAGIPQSMVIDREGKMTALVAGGGRKNIEKLKETVEKLVNE